MKVVNLNKKYGDKIFQDMILLKAGESTLDTVGKNHGLTRERIRQIYEMLFDEKYTNAFALKSKRLHEQKEQSEIEYHKFESRISRSNGRGQTSVGLTAEAAFYEKCKEKGINVTMNRGKSHIDAIVNGYNVDVKCCNVAAFTCKSLLTPYYRFSATKYQAQHVDFFAFCINEYQTWFIIPNIPKNTKSFTKYISSKKINNEWLEAWHLLTEPKKQ